MADDFLGQHFKAIRIAHEADAKQFEGETTHGYRSAQVKEDVMDRLKLAMEHGELTLPRDTPQLLVQITSQRCEPTMSGTLKFSHGRRVINMQLADYRAYKNASRSW